MNIPIGYTVEALSKLTTEQLEGMFNDKTTPTLEMVLHKLGRKKSRKKK